MVFLLFHFFPTCLCLSFQVSTFILKYHLYSIHIHMCMLIVKYGYKHCIWLKKFFMSNFIVVLQRYTYFLLPKTHRREFQSLQQCLERGLWWSLLLSFVCRQMRNRYYLKQKWLISCIVFKFILVTICRPSIVRVSFVSEVSWFKCLIMFLMHVKSRRNTYKGLYFLAL